MSETKTEVKLPKHLASAVNQLQKQVDKYDSQIMSYKVDIGYAEAMIRNLTDSKAALSEQIKRLKGEPTAAEVLQDISKNLK